MARDPAFEAALRQSFAEQVAFFRQKLGTLMPTARWDDLWHEQHDRAFMVAGAAKADLLADLAGAVDKAIAEGETLDAFRKRFAEIVERHGWHGWTGEATAKGRAWRTKIIYETNLITSYAAGRYAQLKEGGYAWWIYKHSDFVQRPRPHHVALDGITRPPDDPFWAQHYPPNGWGCRCRVVGARGEAAIKRLGGSLDKPLPDWVGTLDPKSGAPVGIDKGFAYAPGGSASDTVRPLAKKTVAWPYELAKAFMTSVPFAVRDALATAQRLQPETGEAARRYAERALGVRNQSALEEKGVLHPYLTLGLLTSEQAGNVARLTGIAAVSIELYDWALGRYAPRHIRNEHGDDARESARGQRVPTADDYAAIAGVIESADRVWSDDGKTVLMEKRFERQDGSVERMVLVFEVQKKRRMLALTSMRIFRQPPRAQRP